MKKETKKDAKSKKEVASKPQTDDEILWVWKLTWEDIDELETSVTLYRSEAGAKAAMEEDIRKHISWGFEKKPERKDELHVSLGDRFEWTIKKVQVH